MTTWDQIDFPGGLDALSKAALTPSPNGPWQRETRTDLGALRIERWIPDVGLLVFEYADVGQWLTKKGEPAKKSKDGYFLLPVNQSGDQIDFERTSKIAGCLGSEGLLYYYEDKGAQGAMKAHRLGELEDVPDEEVIGRVRLLNLGADAERDKAAARGTGVHTVLERLALGQPVTKDFLPEAAQPWYDGAVAAWVALQPEPVEVEQIVCHPEDGYAGRPDLVAYVDGVLTLLDWKTGKGKVYAKGHWQARLYERARRRCGFEPVERIIVVGVDEQGGFCPSELPADVDLTPDEVSALLAVYSANRRVEKVLDAQRKAA